MQAEEEKNETAAEPRLLHHGRWSGYRNLLWARMLELAREPEVIFWVFAFPLLLAIGLGIAFRQAPVGKTPVAISAAPGAAHLAQLLKQQPLIPFQVLPAGAALDQFRLGRYDLVLEPQPGGGVLYRFDPSRPESVLARRRVDDALQAAAGRRDVVTTRSRPYRQPGARYIDFLIPGLLGMNLMNSGMWGVGFALVEMRQRKLLKRLIATPMHRSHFLLALGSSRLLLMVVEIVLLLGVGIWIFGMRVEGSWWTILLLGAIGSASFGALGLLTACRAQKIESVSGLLNVVMMPMWVFSGVFFSYQRFPRAVWPLIRLLPLTAINDALRAVILQGAALDAQLGRLLVLAGWGVVSFALALHWFRWK